MNIVDDLNSKHRAAGWNFPQYQQTAYIRGQTAYIRGLVVVVDLHLAIE